MGMGGKGSPRALVLAVTSVCLLALAGKPVACASQAEEACLLQSQASARQGTQPPSSVLQLAERIESWQPWAPVSRLWGASPEEANSRAWVQHGSEDTVELTDETPTVLGDISEVPTVLPAVDAMDMEEGSRPIPLADHAGGLRPEGRAENEAHNRLPNRSVISVEAQAGQMASEENIVDSLLDSLGQTIVPTIVDSMLSKMPWSSQKPENISALAGNGSARAHDAEAQEGAAKRLSQEAERLSQQAAPLTEAADLAPAFSTASGPSPLEEEKDEEAAAIATSAESTEQQQPNDASASAVMREDAPGGATGGRSSKRASSSTGRRYGRFDGQQGCDDSTYANYRAWCDDMFGFLSGPESNGYEERPHWCLSRPDAAVQDSCASMNNFMYCTKVYVTCSATKRDAERCCMGPGMQLQKTEQSSGRGDEEAEGGDVQLQGRALSSGDEEALEDNEVVPGFTSKEDHVCGGKRIDRWVAGQPSNYGRSHEKTLTDCKRECWKHPECAGFTEKPYDERWPWTRCSFWEQGPLAPLPEPGFSCHQRVGGQPHLPTGL